MSKMNSLSPAPTKRGVSALAAAVVSLSGIIVLAGCAGMPMGPTVMALPGTGKSFDQFRADDATCQQFASRQTGGISTQQATATGALGGTAVGTALGAGTGLLGGSMIGAGMPLGWNRSCAILEHFWR
jgi:hypothetical protein